MTNLKKWADKQSPFIKLKDKESFTGVYQGCHEGEYQGTPLIEYSFKNEDGDLKKLSSSSKPLARDMHDVSEGTTVKITRFGTGPDTKWALEALEKDSVDKAEEQRVKEAWGE